MTGWVNLWEVRSVFGMVVESVRGSVCKYRWSWKASCSSTICTIVSCHSFLVLTKALFIIAFWLCINVLFNASRQLMFCIIAFRRPVLPGSLMHPGRPCFQKVNASRQLMFCIIAFWFCDHVYSENVSNEAHASRQLVPSGGQFFQEALCIQAVRASRKSMLPGSSCFV